MFGEVNYLAVLVAAIAHFILGALWYGLIFGKKWQALVDPDGKMQEEMKKGVAVSFIGNFIGALVLSYVTSRIITVVDPTDIFAAIIWSVLVWVGYAMTVDLNGSLFEKKPWGLFMINALYSLLGIVLVFVILFYWK